MIPRVGLFLGLCALVAVVPGAAMPQATTTTSDTAATTSTSAGEPQGSGGSFTGVRITHYDPSVGTSACGNVRQKSEFVIAMSITQFSPSYCGKKVSIKIDGKTSEATVEDNCRGCPYGGIDLSEGLFLQFSPSLDAGVLQGDWSFADGGDAPSVSGQEATTVYGTSSQAAPSSPGDSSGTTVPTSSPGSATTTAAPTSTTSVSIPGAESSPTLAPGAESSPTLAPGAESSPTLAPGAESSPTLAPGAESSPSVPAGAESTTLSVPSTTVSGSEGEPCTC